MRNNLGKETWAGFLGPLIGLGFVLISIMVAPDFSWEVDALSHLGNWLRTDIGPNPLLRAFIFNSGLFVGGLLIIYFTMSLTLQIKDRILKFMLLSIMVNAVFLAGVGVFSENFSFGHFITALGFFLSIPISLAMVGLGFVRIRETRWLGSILLLLAVLAVILFRPWTSLAVWEYVMALVSTAGVILLNIMDATSRLDFLK